MRSGYGLTPRQTDRSGILSLLAGWDLELKLRPGVDQKGDIVVNGRRELRAREREHHLTPPLRVIDKRKSVESEGR
jgi:hypothetical protein